MDRDLDGRRLTVAALVAGLAVAGLPAAYVLNAGGPVLAVVLIALLGLLPAGIALLAKEPRRSR